MICWGIGLENLDDWRQRQNKDGQEGPAHQDPITTTSYEQSRKRALFV